MSHQTTAQRAAELHRRGLSTGEIAAEMKVSLSTVQRAKAARPDLFAEHEPGSREHRRAILLAALDQGSLSEQLRAVELLDKLSAGSQRGNESGRIAVHVHGPRVCPVCGAHLDTEHTEVVRGNES
jgi:hypothetical protein